MSPAGDFAERAEKSSLASSIAAGVCLPAGPLRPGVLLPSPPHSGHPLPRKPLGSGTCE